MHGVLTATLALSLVSCGGTRSEHTELAQALVGTWEGVHSVGGWLGDTIEYVRVAREPAGTVSWRLTLTKDGRFTSLRAGSQRVVGTYALASDTLPGPMEGRVLIEFSADIWDTADFYPRVIGDSLFLDNAWTDAFNHTFVRTQDAQRERR